MKIGIANTSDGGGINEEDELQFVEVGTAIVVAFELGTLREKGACRVRGPGSTQVIAD
jgi:hypothetical protein